MIDEFSGDYRFLSNFWELDIPLVVDGLVFDSVEAAYQAMKTLDPIAQGKFQELTPSEAKKFGRTVDLREDWEEVKIGIMTDLARMKFENNPHLAHLLLETYDEMLLEGNWWGDHFWGVDRKTHFGENHLGRILMQIRGELRNTP